MIRCALLAVLVLCGAVACAPTTAPNDDAGAGSDAGAGPDAGAGSDAGADDGGATSDAGPSSEAPCTFNRDCIEAERCECDEATGCFCRRGARGDGQSGVDACVDGNGCESSLCVEGPGGDYYCSGECVDAGDCGPMLPVCADIAFLGRVCVRESP